MKIIFCWISFTYCLIHALYPLCMTIASLLGWDFFLISNVGYSSALTIMSLVILSVTLMYRNNTSRFDSIFRSLCWPLGTLDMVAISLLNEPSYHLISMIVVNLSTSWIMYQTVRKSSFFRLVIRLISVFLTTAVVLISLFALSTGNYCISNIVQKASSPDGDKDAIIVAIDREATQWKMIRVVDNPIDVPYIGIFCTNSQVIYYEEKSLNSKPKIAWIDNDTLQIDDEFYSLSTEQ